MGSVFLKHNLALAHIPHVTVIVGCAVKYEKQPHLHRAINFLWSKKWLSLDQLIKLPKSLVATDLAAIRWYAFSVSLISDTFFGLFFFMTSAKYFIYKALNIWLINYKETSTKFSLTFIHTEMNVATWRHSSVCGPAFLRLNFGFKGNTCWSEMRH